MTKPLENQLALVTGASRGIGAATAEALAAAGAHVVLTARTVAGLEQVEERIHDAGGSATIAPLDLSDADGISRLAEAISGRWKALDILVLNAATLGTLTFVGYLVSVISFGLSVRRRRRATPDRWDRAVRALAATVIVTIALLLVSGTAAHNVDRGAWYLMPAILACAARSMPP